MKYLFLKIACASHFGFAASFDVGTAVAARAACAAGGTTEFLVALAAELRRLASISIYRHGSTAERGNVMALLAAARRVIDGNYVT